jgi:hypothetical protein
MSPDEQELLRIFQRDAQVIRERQRPHRIGSMDSVSEQRRAQRRRRNARLAVRKAKGETK